MQLQTINFIFACLKRINHFIDLVITNNNSVAHTVLTSFISFFDADSIRTINENFNIFCFKFFITHNFNSSGNESNNSTCVLAVKTSVINCLTEKEGSYAFR